MCQNHINFHQWGKYVDKHKKVKKKKYCKVKINNTNLCNKIKIR